MPGTNPSESTMKIARLGECTNLWSELVKSPKCVIGGFTINLEDLRQLLGDDATLSYQLEQLLNGYLYVANDEDNPSNLSVSELYSTGEKIDVIFDPLHSAELDWAEADNLLQRQDDADESRTVNYTEMLDQMEARIALFANRPLQRKLIARLKETQNAYAKSWTHFHQRINEFWNLTYEVCLDRTPESSPQASSSQQLAQAAAPQVLLNWIFLASENNRRAYQNQLYAKFEEELYLSQTLADIHALLDRMNAIIGPASRGRKRPQRYKDIIFEALLAISGQFIRIWPEIAQPLLDTPMADDFRESMQAIEGMVLDEFNLNRLLSTYKNRINLTTASKTFVELRELVQDALYSWHLLSVKPPKGNAAATRDLSKCRVALDDVIKYMAIAPADGSDDDAPTEETEN